MSITLRLKDFRISSNLEMALLSFLFAFLFSQITSAQVNTVTAKVVYNYIGVPNVEVINSITKKIVLTNNEGIFSIEAHPGETLVFVAASFELKKFTVGAFTFKNKDLIIELFKTATELNEVVVEQVKVEHIGADAGYSSELKIKKQQFSSKVADYGSNPIPNGPDIISIIGLVAKLFKGDDDSDQRPKKVLVFRKVANDMFPSSYFTETLKLQPENLTLFFEYCESDAESNVILQNVNELAMMEFLEKKAELFRHLPK